MIKLFFLLATFWQLHAEVIERVVAVVNEEPILYSDVDRYKEQLKSGANADDLILEDPKELLKDRNLVLEQLINEKIIEGEIKRQSLTTTIERIEQEVNNIQKRNGMTRKQLVTALSQQGMEFSNYQNFIKKRIERQSLIEKMVTSKIKISDDDVDAEFALKHKGAPAATSYEYTLAHILFLPRGKPLSDAEARANAVLAKLKQGQNFETLAQQYSEDPNFSAGGVLGSFKSKEFLKELEDAAKTLPVGGNSDVVKTKYGVHILKLLDKKVVPDPQQEKEKEKLRQDLYQVAFKKQFKLWLAQKRQDSFVRTNKW